MAASYPIGTFAQMAAIPAEARERFIAELPELFRIADRLAAVNSDLAPLGVELEPLQPVWVDDDKRTSTVTIRSGEGEPVLSVTTRF